VGNPGFFVVLAVFIASFSAALASNAPGGLGVFELLFIKAMPATPQVEVLSALLVFRLFYLIVRCFFRLSSSFCSNATSSKKCCITRRLRRRPLSRRRLRPTAGAKPTRPEVRALPRKNAESLWRGSKGSRRALQEGEADNVEV